MALFKGDNKASRAVEIIKGIKPVSSQDPAEPKPQDPPSPPAEPKPQDPPSPPAPGNTHIEPKDPPSPPAADKPSAAMSEESVLNFLSERLNKQFKSFDELLLSKEPELDPELQQLLDWKKKTGLSLSDFSKYNRDFSKLSDLDVVREIRSQKYPNLSTEELEYLMKDVTFDPENDDDNARMEKSVKLKTIAADGRQTLEQNKLDLKPSLNLTKEQQEDLALAQQVRQQQQAQKADAEAYRKNLEKAALSLNAVNMQLSDELSINYDIPEGERRTLPDFVANMPHWFNKDGTVNHEAIVRDAVVIKEYPNMIKKAFEQGISVGTENKIRKDKNIPQDPGKEPMGDPGKTKKGNINDIVDNIAGGNKNRTTRFRFTPPQK